MVSPPARLISGADWIVCGIGSIVIHTLSVQCLPWSVAVPSINDRAPVAIEMVILPEAASTSDLSALSAIPLDKIPDVATSEPITNSDPVTSLSPPVSSNPTFENPPRENPPPPVIRPIPRPANSFVQEQSQPSVLTGNNIRIPLDLPLAPSIETPDPTRLESNLEENPNDRYGDDADPAVESALPLPDFPLNGFPSNPSGDPTQPSHSLPTDPIGGVAIVSANPGLLEFRVTVQPMVSPEANPANNSQDHPRPYHQQLILTANPQIRGCTVPTLEALRSNGETIILSLAIDAQGSVMSDRTLVKQSNAHPDYNKWAMCLLQDWRFSPAENTPSGNSVLTQVSVQIEVLSYPSL